MQVWKYADLWDTNMYSHWANRKPCPSSFWSSSHLGCSNSHGLLGYQSLPKVPPIWVSSVERTPGSSQLVKSTCRWRLPNMFFIRLSVVIPSILWATWDPTIPHFGLHSVDYWISHFLLAEFLVVFLFYIWSHREYRTLTQTHVHFKFIYIA